MKVTNLVRELWTCIGIFSTFTGFFLPGIAWAEDLAKKDTQAPFLFFMEEKSGKIWSDQVGPKLKQALADYSTNKKLPNGRAYGHSIRNLNLERMCPDEIDARLKAEQCKIQEDVLKDPKTRKPLHLPDGQTIPMRVYLCPDGGVVRLKISGDPLSRFRPQPHASKSLRHPYNSLFNSFDDEVVKVDNQGHLIPKWVKDLKLEGLSEEKRSEIIRSWAEDAHTDLPQNCQIQNKLAK